LISNVSSALLAGTTIDNVVLNTDISNTIPAELGSIGVASGHEIDV
jgi:hypothetical protein